MNNSYDVINAINFAVNGNNTPNDINEYNFSNVSNKIINIILSNYEFDKI